jgi:multidrug efflux system membrane fusion protein
MNKTVFLLLGVALVLGACSKPVPTAEPIRAVKLLTVGVDDFSANYEFAGVVKAQVESRLGFRVAGKIIKRQAAAGQHVAAGQVLAELDPRDYQLASDASRAQMTAAATNLDLAAADYRRYKELKDQNFISGAELERREATLKAAQAQLVQAQAQLAVQGNQIQYTVLRADVSGVVTAVDAEAGQVVSAGMPVLQIAADGARDVVFSVPEDKVAAIQVGMPVQVQVWAQNSRLNGKVREVAAIADVATRTYAVKVALATTTPPALGSTVQVNVPGLGADVAPVIKLPTSALRQEGKASAVWVLDPVSMTLQSRIVQIATADGNEVVIASGLSPGMQVVSAGVHVLSPGQKVTVYQPRQVTSVRSPAQTAINPLAALPVAAVNAGATAK